MSSLAAFVLLAHAIQAFAIDTSDDDALLANFASDNLIEAGRRSD